MKTKKFEELSEFQQAAVHNLDKHTLFLLHNALRTISKSGVCKPRLEICSHCPVKGMAVIKVGYGGPMACSLIELEVASRGRYLAVTSLQDTECDQCGALIKAGMRCISVPQYGYRALNFCIKCVEKSQE